MANLTRYNPFDLDWMNSVDDLFKGFFLPVQSAALPQAKQVQMKLDVSETERNYAVRAEIPGAKKEDIHVSVNGNQVSISAEAQQQNERKEGEKVIYSERYQGSVSRSFTLPQEIQEDQAQAKYEDGVLTLTLPKKEEATARKLTID